MSTLTCFLNTSPTKNVLWLKDKSGLLKGNPFMNLESNQARDILIDILREAYVRGTSFELLIDVRDIQTRQNGTMSVSSTLETILSTMTETVKAEPKPVDTKALAKAESLLAGLRSRPVIERVAVAGTTDDDDLFDFLEA
jgi:hypothetical protein